MTRHWIYSVTMLDQHGTIIDTEGLIEGEIPDGSAFQAVLGDAFNKAPHAPEDCPHTIVRLELIDAMVPSMIKPEKGS